MNFILKLFLYFKLILIFIKEMNSTYQNLENKNLRVNPISTSIVILGGLIGNSIVIFVFGQKTYRTNPSHVYFLCSAIVDSLFLIVHFFEVYIFLKYKSRLYEIKSLIILGYFY